MKQKEEEKERLVNSTRDREEYDAIEKNGGMQNRQMEGKDFFCISVVVLLGDTARGVMFPTLWPFLLQLGARRTVLGIAVAAFSFGRYKFI